jgi:murein L,D-transpeptidase YafK
MATLFLCQMGCGQPTTSAFWQQQLSYPRVQAAHAACWPRVQGYLQAHELDPARLELFIRAFKIGRRVEAWGRPLGSKGSFMLLHSYYLAGTSGTLGPKLHAGDGQIPEGCYTIDRLNPKSLFHLSLGLDYPTAADRARSTAAGYTDPGGDIFIHGSNVTIGCLPITDACIEELYLLAVAARASGQQRIPVHIFPFELSPYELSQRAADSPHCGFWQGLVPAYTRFAQTHTLPPDTAAAVAIVAAPQ